MVRANGLVDVDEQLVRQLAERARADGLKLTGEGGLLQRLTKLVVESSLEGELDDHLGYGKHDAAGRDGGNSRNGKRAKTVLTEAGPVEIEVPRDRESSFEPKLVVKRQRRLSGVDDLVIWLSAKGLTHGEISAHLAEIYGAEVSKQTISTITDRVMEGMAEWQSRPLDPACVLSVVANVARWDAQMPRGGSNQMPGSVKKRYFELVREGHMGAAAAPRGGVSTSCGSLWFLDAGGVMISDPGPISPRFLDQDDRIAIADGLRAGQHKKEIAIAIGKSL